MAELWSCPLLLRNNQDPEKSNFTSVQSGSWARPACLVHAALPGDGTFWGWGEVGGTVGEMVYRFFIVLKFFRLPVLYRLLSIKSFKFWWTGIINSISWVVDCIFLLLLRLTNDFSLNEFEDEDLSELTKITDQYHDQVGAGHQMC